MKATEETMHMIDTINTDDSLTANEKARVNKNWIWMSGLALST
jgi:hypothetical protein